MLRDKTDQEQLDDLPAAIAGIGELLKRAEMKGKSREIVVLLVTARSHLSDFGVTGDMTLLELAEEKVTRAQELWFAEDS